MATLTSTTPETGRGPGIARGWVVFTRLLMLAVFSQAVFAGLLLSGEGWGRTAHRSMAEGLVAGTLLAGIVAAVTLRRVAGGRRLALTLIALAVCLAVQMTLGLLSADGERLLWLHVPFGVALVGFADQLARSTRRRD